MSSALSSQNCPENQSWPGVLALLPSVVPVQPCLVPSNILITPAVSCFITSQLPRVTTNCVGCVGVFIFPFVVHCRGSMGGDRGGGGSEGLGMDRFIMFLAHFCLHVTLFLSMGGLHRRRPSCAWFLPSWNAFWLVLHVMVQGVLNCGSKGCAVHW